MGWVAPEAVPEQGEEHYREMIRAGHNGDARKAASPCHTTRRFVAAHKGGGRAIP